jgi:hypothetical protein
MAVKKTTGNEQRMKRKKKTPRARGSITTIKFNVKKKASFVGKRILYYFFLSIRVMFVQKRPTKIK